MQLAFLPINQMNVFASAEPHVRQSSALSACTQQGHTAALAERKRSHVK